MADITPDDVARFIAVQEVAGQKGWTIKGQLVVLGGVFKYAIRHLGVQAANPVALLERAERPKADEDEKRILTSDELERLLAEADDVLFDFAAQTGARLAEALGVVWSELGLSALPAVTFTHQLDRKGKRQPLKRKRSRRCIEITTTLAAKLRAHKMASPYSGPHDFVFATALGTGHDHRNIGGRVLGRVVKRAGLEAVRQGDVVIVPAPTFHDLRHTHASALIAAGWDIEEVSARLGHAAVSTTMRIYTHAYDAAKRSDQRRGRLSLMYGANAETNTQAQDGDNPAKSRDGESSRLVEIGSVQPKTARKA